MKNLSVKTAQALATSGWQVDASAETVQNQWKEWLRVGCSRDVVPAIRHEVPDLIDINEICLYRIEEITYEDEAPQLEALENVFSCMAVPGVNLIYLVLGEKGKSGVRFYFGFSRDCLAKKKKGDTSVKAKGETFLKPALVGNFRGSKVSDALLRSEKERIHDLLNGYVGKDGCCQILAGVPGGMKDKEAQSFRGIDRLVDVMQGDDFAFMVIAKPITTESLAELRRNVFSTYGFFSALSKVSVQNSKNSSVNVNRTLNYGENWSFSSAHSQGTNRNDSLAVADGDTNGTTENDKEGHTGTSSQHSRTATRTIGGGTSEQNTDTAGKGGNLGGSVAGGETEGVGLSTTRDLTNKDAADWVKYFDDVLIPRLDYARGKGAFVVNVALMGANANVVSKLTSVARSIFAGETANMVPFAPYDPDEGERRQLENFALPYVPIHECPEIEPWLPCVQSKSLEYCGMAVVGGKFEEKVLYSGNWMSARELALMASLPKKEVVGLRLKKEVEFGLNVPDALGKDKKPLDEKDLLPLGTLVKSGNECRECTVSLVKSSLDSHVFVAGVTKSGKTTTCQTLLLESGWPFLVIEPAKTEYRGLRNSLCKDLLVFTLGDETVAPFRLNPFEMIPGESVTARVDMLMASISAAFDMEAAIPQLIERAIYACYEDYGWNIGTSENRKYPYLKDKDGKVNLESGPFAPGVFAFPTLSDVLKKTETVVDEQGFDARLKKDYIGSIKARLQGLTLGAKGFMLDTPRSVDFLKLIEQKVVLELEPIPNGAQKSLVIGFVLTNLLQAVKRKFKKSGGRKFHHITLVEEAHRLLAKPEPGGGTSQKQAAETFSDMLAEIRKYGESLVIADQIPCKLTPDVLKNTNTKIIHRIFAQDDKDAVGHTMGLDEDQMAFLSNLTPGRAIVFSGDWTKAVQVQVTAKYNTEAETSPEEDNVLRESTLAYHAQDDARLLDECRLVRDYEHAGRDRFPVLEFACQKQGVDTLLARLVRLLPSIKALADQYRAFFLALSRADDDLSDVRTDRCTISFCPFISNSSIKKGKSK